MATMEIQEKKERKLRKLDDEIWKEVQGSEGRYMISNYGRVKSFVYNNDNGKIMKFSHIRNFQTINLKIGDTKKTCLVHKLTAEAFVPKPMPEYNTVVHLDWNPKNNYFKNLEWVSREMSSKRIAEYLHEQRKNGPKKVTYSKLKPEDIKLLKSMLQRGVRQNLIAKMFRISEMQVTRIKRGENWGEITVGPENEN
jgi:hypothetical protein